VELRQSNETGGGFTLIEGAADAGLRTFMLGVYTKLALGLGLAGAFAWVVGNVPEVSRVMFNSVAGEVVGYTPIGLVVVFAPLALLVASAFVMRRPSARGSGLLYWSVVTLIGASLGGLFFVYVGGSLATTFLITAAAFGALSLWGYATHRNLTGLGSFLLVGVAGLIIAMLVNLFVRSSALYLAVDVAGVLIFAGLIAYDTQRLKLVYQEAAADQASLATATSYGALTLFINFINLFQFLLSLTGQRRR
jgi:uncharacterized protein